MNRIEIKKLAKQELSNNFFATLLPLFANILWGIIFAIAISINILLYNFTYIFIGIPVSVFIIIALIFVVCNIKLKTAEFYFSYFCGSYKLHLSDFFNFSNMLNKIWSLMVVDVITFVLSIMAIFLGGYVNALYCIKDYAIVDLSNKYGKDYIDVIPK